MEHIQENLLEIKYNISKAAAKSGRSADQIKLVAVSKTFGADYVRRASELGITDFGENRVQELLPKQDAAAGANWHMIGHLQTNKVRQIIGKVCLIHSVDSEKLAKEIDRISKINNIISDCLIEVNIAGEATKYGVQPEKTALFAHFLSKLPNIRLRGLMCVAPYVENGERNRDYFYQINKLCLDINNKSYDNVYMDTLSMGMTNDYVTAIEEGANIVRIGTGLFGNR